MSRSAPHAVQSHPAPARGEISLAALAFGLAAGPAGWILQHLADYGLAAYACFPGHAALADPAPGWGGVRWALAVITFAGLALAAAGWRVAWRSWRATRHEHAGGHPDLLEAGSGRSRFFALSGVLVSILFVGVTLFSGIMLVGAPLCRG